MAHFFLEAKERLYSRDRGEVAHCILEAKEKEVTDYFLEAGLK